MNWQQVSMITDQTTAPKVADFLTDLGALSVTYMDADDQPVYEPAPGETRIWQSTKVMALFEMTIELALVKTVLFSRFESSRLEHWQQEVLEDRAWERTWLAHYQPMKFADKLWVCPTGQEKDEADTVCMTLDPGLAFGTGTHPTTALCLEWLASHFLTDKIVIDYGCGSGILAVAAALLGAKHIYAVDIDPQAITATQANAEKNQVSDQISCYLPEQFTPLAADIVLANILAQPLCQLAASMTDLVKTDGQLILSGILTEQADTVIAAYQVHQLYLSSLVNQDGWCRLDGQKKQPRYVHAVS